MVPLALEQSCSNPSGSRMARLDFSSYLALVANANQIQSHVPCRVYASGVLKPRQATARGGSTDFCQCQMPYGTRYGMPAMRFAKGPTLHYSSLALSGPAGWSRLRCTTDQSSHSMRIGDISLLQVDTWRGILFLIQNTDFLEFAAGIPSIRMPLPLYSDLDCGLKDLGTCLSSRTVPIN